MKKVFVLFIIALLFVFSSCASSESKTSNFEHTCTIEIRCDEALASSLLSAEKRELLPENGMIISKCEVGFSDGEYAFDVFLREIKSRKIHIDFTENPAYNSKYIRAVANLYEFDCGENSGWLYYVNGKSPDVGYNQYILNPGDAIALSYTEDWSKIYNS